MKPDSKIMYLVFSRMQTVWNALGLIPAMAVVLASSSLRIQVGRDTSSVWRSLKESGFPKLREWQYWGEAGTASTLSSISFKIWFI